MRLMAVMAHPDDAEIWCGGTLILHAQKGDTLRVCTLSYAEDSIRGKEALEGAKLMGCETECLGLEDTRIRDSDDAVERLRKSLDSFEPEIIITHWFDDMHPDHEAAFLILRRALVSRFLNKTIDAVKPAAQIFCCDTYGSMGIKGPFEPHLQVNVSQVWERKVAAINAHKSQPLQFYLNMIEQQCRVHGMAAGIGFAEAFIRVPMFGRLDKSVQLGD